MHHAVLSFELRDLPISNAPQAAVSGRPAPAYVDIPSVAVREELPEHNVVNRHKHWLFS